MKRVTDFSKISKEKLIELYIKKCEDCDVLEAKFYQEQKEKNEAIKEKDEALKELAKYKEKDALNRQRLFGKKTEQSRLIDKENVINEAEKEAKKTKKAGRKKGSKNFSKEYLESHCSQTVYLEPENIDELKKECDLIELEPDVFYKVEVVPSSYKVIKIISKKYFERNTKNFYQAVKEDDPFPHSICTPELATNIMINKFMYGLPYYRQSEVMINDGLYISRQDLCNFQLRSTEILKPFYDFLKQKLLNNTTKVICADETTLRVLETDKTNCYAWVYISTFYDYPIYIYEFSIDRKRENITNFLGDYEGYLLTDCYAGYANLPKIKNAYCWAHARRRFAEICKSLSDKQLKVSIAREIMDLINQLFVNEKEFKEAKYGPQKILEMRNSEEYLEIVNKIFDILHNTEPDKGSALSNAFKYVLDHEDGFKTFLEDGHIDLSNNISERAIKPFVIDRKNFLFSNTQNGAESSLIFFSLQQTARANGVDPIKYISYLIKELGKANATPDFEELLPWKFKSTMPY